MQPHYFEQYDMNYQQTPRNLISEDVAETYEPSRKFSINPRSTSQEELNTQILASLEKIAFDDLDTKYIDRALQILENCSTNYQISLNDPTESPEFSQYFKNIVTRLNDHALGLLKQDKISGALRILEKCAAYNHLGNGYPVNAILKNITYNHLACCNRRLGKIIRAKELLEEALQFIDGANAMENLGITHLNLSAVFSQMGEYILYIIITRMFD